MIGLFPDDFPVAENNDDLARIRKEYPKYYDPYYIASGAILKRRALFEELYEKFQPYKDSHFDSQVKIDFNARSWEMYLANVFLENGIAISSSDKGPDIKIEYKDRNIWIECVASKNGSGSDRVPELLYNGSFQSYPEREMMLRLTGNMEDKFKKYEEYRKKGIVGDEDIFIIAINRSALDHLDPGIPLILKVLFSIGHPSFSIHALDKTRKTSTKPFWSKRANIRKKSGEPIPVNYFEDEKYSGVSAVIYSKTSVLSHPKNVGSDCIIVHNPKARNPLPLGSFPFFDEYQDQDDKIVKL